jgi:uncharacterized protein DUF6851
MNTVLTRAMHAIAITSLVAALGCGDNNRPTGWSTVASDLRESIMSIDGTSPTDVWAVGADRGEGPVVLHYDGTAWTELPTSERASLWWVHAFKDGPVFLAGAQSTILRYDHGAFVRMPTIGLSRHTVFGLWGPTPTDLYAVGSLGSANGFVWHYDGTAWSDVALPESLPKDAQGNTAGLFKVWGNGDGTVWVVGGAGTVLRSRNGGAFEYIPVATTATLFTVAGDASRTYIVGGGGQAVVLEAAPGQDPVPVPLDGVSIVQGVAAGGDGKVYATGEAGSVFERTATGWQRLTGVPPIAVQSLHAAWVDPEGGLWTVGGNVLTSDLDAGGILHLGLHPTPAFSQPPLPPAASTECPAAAIDPRPEGSIARRWNEQILNAIRRDVPRPPVHARNLFHLAIAMWDAWAAFDPTADGYLVHDKVTASDVALARQEAISYAAYRVLQHRYADPIAVGFAVSQHCFAAFMTRLDYDPADTTVVGDSPRALGNRIGQAVIEYGLSDGANEQNNYKDTTGWAPTNPALTVDNGGNTLTSPSTWQQLNLAQAETQNGIPLTAGVQAYVGAQWGLVKPFAMIRPAPDAPYHDPGPPPMFGPALAPALVDIISRESRQDPSLDPMIDISPGALGNNPLGTNDGVGHAVNPVTGVPYAPNRVKLGDFARVLAEFWADGPNSETPPGHWDTLANAVADHPLHVRKLFGAGPTVDPLEWDVKVYFAVNGATHDAAIASWEIKRRFLAGRPVSWIRYMASLGQSSDPQLPSYSPDGLPLVPGLIELITAETTQPGQRHAHLKRYLGQVAVLSWRGEPGNRKLEVGGVGWIRGAEWLPYQRRTFVTPAFPGFISGHSTFSRAAAEVLTGITGDAFFPGGVGEFTASANAYLVFERGPSADVVLQWGTYYDAADQAGQSRLWGGIHIQSDDFAGRIAGSQVGLDALARARTFYDGTAVP